MAAEKLANDERWNAGLHGFGVVLFMLTGSALVARLAVTRGPWQWASALVFVLSLLTLYSASTLYHLSRDAIHKRRYKIFDHCAIYFLIAGSYTPFALNGLRAHGGWWLFLVIWTLAICGVIFKLFFTGRFLIVSTLIYLAMGWLVMLVMKPLIAALTTATLMWLIAGGAAYTLGAIFYLQKRYPYAHTIWHAFVLLGSASHFVAVYLHLR
jgi:hemolysin III